MQLQSLARSALEQQPQIPALRFEDQWFPWRWLRQVADQADAHLTQCGLLPTARVGLIARNNPAFIATFLAAIRSGRSIVMVHALQSPESLAAEVSALDLEALMADAQDWTEPLLAAARQSDFAGIATYGAKDGAVLVHRPAAARRGEQPGGVIELLTSGTTGKPKRIAMSFDMIARSMVLETSVSTDAAVRPPALMMFPFGNISGIYSYLPTLASGQPVVLLDRFRVNEWVRFVREYRPVTMSIPPAGVRMMLEGNVTVEDLSSVQYLFSGASWLDPNTQAEFLERYQIPILLSYGATEFGGVVSAMTPSMWLEFGRRKLASVGKPWANASIRISDPETREVLPVGQTGVIEIKVPRCGPEWIATTDLGLLDEDGFLFHRGRTDGAIMRGGYKVLPEAVAEKLSLHPAVASVAVIGRPDARLGQVPVAAIEVRPSHPKPSVEELEAHARRHLPKTHIPTRFLIVDELPRTLSMKIFLPGVAALFDTPP